MVWNIYCYISLFLGFRTCKSKVRNEVTHLVLNEIPPERPLKFARLCDGRTFDPETGRWFEFMLFSYFSLFSY